MKNKPGKIVKSALDLLICEAEVEPFVCEELGMSLKNLKKAVKNLKENYVLVPVDDPGMRMVDTEIDIK